MMLNQNNLGNVARDLGHTAQSVEYYIKALEIGKRINNLYEQANILNNLAISQIELNELPLALLSLNEAEKVIHGIGSTSLLLNNLTVRSDLLIKQKKFETAIKVIDKRDRLKDSLNHVDRSKQFEQIKAIVDGEKKLQEYQMLKKLNQVQHEKIRNARIIQILAAIVIVIVLTFLLLLLRNNKIIKKLNRSLIERTNEVEDLNEELQVANEELEAQRDSLVETLEKLEKSQDKLIQSEKMASLGILAAGIAHEINNPLNYIQGGINAIKDSVTEALQKHSTEIISFLEIIETGVKRATAIVSSLSHYSRKEEHVTETCDIHRIIDNCILLLNHRIEERIEVNKEFTSDFFTISCNEGKLHQAILNIIINSIDAIDKKGVIRISTQVRDRMLWLTIIDNGCGIPSENIPKLTDPFFTTKDPGKGTGLGLAIALRTIQDINGTIEFWSEVSKGTIVQINLPVGQKVQSS
jgi:signal transduction histidine kinase